jgi:WD40 repeat protein
MLSPNRLEELLKQAVSYQVNTCKFHNTFVPNYSLLSNHTCRLDALPSKCIATLSRHKDQVWIVKFSSTGEKIASLCKDGSICIWSLALTSTIELKCLLEIITKFSLILCINWTNTSDDFLVAAGKDKLVEIWSAKTGANVLSLE